MSQITTPLSALPARNATPIGTVTVSNTRGRLTLALSGVDGGATARLVMKTEGGDWAFVPDGVILVQGGGGSTRAVGVLDFTNRASATQYHVVLDAGSAAVRIYLAGLVDPATSTALVAHASTHLAGGADDLLGAPGTVGGATPGVFAGTFGPSTSNQNTVPSVNGDVFVLAAATQTVSGKTFVAPTFSGALALGSTAFDLSGGTGAFKTPTGAATIGGGTAAVTISSSAAAVSITGGAASSIGTAVGAQSVDGAAGVLLKRGGTTILDVGGVTATATLAAGASLSMAAGAGGLALGLGTGDAAMPTGALSWAGAANKNLSLVAQGTGTVTISNGAAMNIGTTDTMTMTLGRSGQSLVVNSDVTFGGKNIRAAAAALVADPGASGAIPVTSSGVVPLTTAAAETRTLADPTFLDQALAIVLDVDGGDCVVTAASAVDSAAHAVMTFSAAGQCINLVGARVGGALKWRLRGVDGVALS